MKKLLSVLLTLFLTVIFVSCKTPTTENDITFDSKTPLSHITGNIVYVANISSRTYHLSSCRYANSLKEENKHITTDLEFLTLREYTPCKICIKSSK